MPHGPPHRASYEHPASSRLPLSRSSDAEGRTKASLDELLVAGYIEMAQSPFGAGVLFVEKHDKTLRLCVDYLRINAITVKDVYPTPRVDVSVDKVKGARF